MIVTSTVDVKIGLNGGVLMCVVDFLVWNEFGLVLIWQVFVVLMGTLIIVQKNLVYLK